MTFRIPPKPLPIKSNAKILENRKAQLESSLFLNLAATKIQSFFRGHLIRHDPYRHIKRKILFHMDAVNKKIIYSSTADICNKECKYNDYIKLKDIDLSELADLEENWMKEVESIKSLINYGFATCMQYAVILYCIIMEDPEIDEKFKQSLKIVNLLPPENHCFLISKYEDDPIQVHDVWMHLINLPEKYGYRHTAINSADRTQGYYGDEESFRKYLEAHADEKFIKANTAHDYICYPFPTDSIVLDPSKRKEIFHFFYSI